MSNVYHTEPPTRGKVVFHTSVGAVDVELWPKEAPNACRNFVQLALEGYYDRTTFHRVVPGFLAQGGDPTGTGEGGDSVWGKPFRDECHARIKFNHRGQLAMANENRPDTNRAQFFFSLDACPWLDGKHTIFGTVAGNTVFNLLRMGEVETDKDDKPLEDIDLKTVEVLVNPFDDIVPRDLGAAARQAKAEKIAAEKAARPKGVKKANLLSFGEDGDAALPAKKMKAAEEIKRDEKPLKEVGFAVEEESSEDEEEEVKGTLKKAVAAAAPAPKKDRKTDAESFAATMKARLAARAGNAADRERREKARRQRRAKDDDEYGMEGALAAGEDAEVDSALEAKRKEAREERRRLRQSKAAAAAPKSAPAPTRLGAAERRADEKAAKDSLVSPFEALRRKNRDKTKRTRGREADTLARLAAFSGSLKKTKETAVESDAPAPEPVTYAGQVLDADDSDDGAADWFSGKLKFRRHTDDLFRTGGDGRSADDYALIDPRNKVAVDRSGRPEQYTGQHGRDLEQAGRKRGR